MCWAAGLDDSASDAVGAHKRRAIATAIQDIDRSRRSWRPFIVDIPLGLEGTHEGPDDCCLVADGRDLVFDMLLGLGLRLLGVWDARICETFAPPGA